MYRYQRFLNKTFSLACLSFHWCNIRGSLQCKLPIDNISLSEQCFTIYRSSALKIATLTEIGFEISSVAFRRELSHLKDSSLKMFEQWHPRSSRTVPQLKRTQ